jgi:hypothetical protein
MGCSAFLFFGRVIGIPQLAPFLAKTDLGNTPFRHDPYFSLRRRSGPVPGENAREILLGVLPGGTISYAYAINSSGQVVGFSDVP